jgi:hypothetical protein
MTNQHTLEEFAQVQITSYAIEVYYSSLALYMLYIGQGNGPTQCEHSPHFQCILETLVKCTLRQPFDRMHCQVAYTCSAPLWMPY